jgi:eukaryotic-like serine/threonine-protein kinase
MENWSKVSEILVDCLEIEASERQKYLNDLNVDPEIRAEVESFLALEEGVQSSLNLSAIEFSKGFFDGENEAENAVAGQMIGTYRVIRELGYGGMGAVYLAERDDGKFEQKVALKLLKREMNTAALRRRFAQEREILASLEHPHIARLLDAGTTADKIPYLAMEYVEGLPIDDYCNRHRLDIAQRLDLFREVCAAVDFAHRNLIVHRDLKPSNILVTAEGKPKLLDFGISKILSKEFEQMNSATITKLGVMTPSYASPEQIQSKSVTTATDIYSLGVILYELLSGHRPFENKEDNLKEICQAIIETDPPLPSAMIETATDRMKSLMKAETVVKPEANFPLLKNKNFETDAGRMRHTNPQTVNLSSNSLRGDLDNIILKALRKEPERRYSSAGNLSEDLKRHLRGLPVTARPNTLSYRAEKFIKRNKVSVLAGGIVLLAIVGGLVTTLWQARIARAERSKAEKRFDDVRNLANSFLFRLSPKIEKLPGSTEARKELVTLALGYLDNLSKEATDDLELQRELAAAYEKVGDVQGNPMEPNLGDFKGASESYEKALRIRQTLFEKQPDNPTAISDLAGSFAAISRVQMQVGTTEKVDEFFKKSLALRREVVKMNPNDFAARKNLAIALRSQGVLDYSNAKYKEAVKNYDLAAAIYAELLNEQPENIEIAENYAYTFIDRGISEGWDNELEAAEKSLQTGLDLLIPLAAEYSDNQSVRRSLMLAYSNRAASTVETGNYPKAAAESLRSVEIAEDISRADPLNYRAKWDVVTMKKNHADRLGFAGKGREALDLLDATLKTAIDLSRDDPNNTRNLYEIATIRLKTAETYFELKDFEAALKIFQRAKEDYQSAVNNDVKYRFAVRTVYLTTLSIADTYVALAEKRNDKKLYRSALENYRSALEGFSKMKDEGKLGEYDEKLFTEIETGIRKIKDNLKN